MKQPQLLKDTPRVSTYSLSAEVSRGTPSGKGLSLKAGTPGSLLQSACCSCAHGDKEFAFTLSTKGNSMHCS